MKTVPTQMQTDLDSGATTHCYCWAITVGGFGGSPTLGFTDHDLDLSFEGISFRAETGLDASAISRTDGLRVDDMDAVGILDSEAITSQDIANGIYDNALVTIWRVDWTDVSNRVILMRGPIGTITRGRIGYRAQLKSLSAYSDVKTGNVYSTKCRHTLGDSICRVSLTGNFAASGVVASVVSRRIFATTASTVVDKDAGWWTGGLLTWTSGNNNGRRVEVRFQSLSGSTATFELFEPMQADIAANDAFSITTGCEKTIGVCNSKFNNVLNYGGFPRVPQQDFILSYPRRTDLNDGGSLFR